MENARTTPSFFSPSDWFSLQRYAPLRRMTERQWGQQILKRVIIRDAFDGLDGISVAGESPIWLTEQMDQTMTDLLSAPLTVPYNDSSRLVPVRPISLREMENISRGVDEYFVKLAKREPDKDLPLDDMFGTDNNFLGHLAINLLARDSEIRAAFDSWLQARRQGFSTESSATKLRNPAILEWCGSQVIPYFDLVLWKRWTRANLTQPEIANLLFPDVYDTSDRDKLRATLNTYDKYMTKANAAALASSVGV